MPRARAPLSGRLPRPRGRIALRVRAVVLAVGLAGVIGVGGLTACSTPSPGADTPEAAVTTFYRALGAKDTGAACALVAYNGIPLSGDDITLCRSGFDAIVTDIATPEELAALGSTSATGSTVTGDTATVRADQLTGVPAAYREDVSLVRVAGRWYILSPL
ncbi:MAG: hypothetical protein IPH27_07530 [Actinomycetales bacterium]|nr:hypothetical protein [Candidatus Phosphoribacter baldrii]MBK6955293.1 hypothetical protein [Candidatus Phosphoribacter baldrii]